MVQATESPARLKKAMENSQRAQRMTGWYPICGEGWEKVAVLLMDKVDELIGEIEKMAAEAQSRRQTIQSIEAENGYKIACLRDELDQTRAACHAIMRGLKPDGGRFIFTPPKGDYAASPHALVCRAAGEILVELTMLRGLTAKAEAAPTNGEA